MKNAFYSIWKALFVFEIETFESRETTFTHYLNSKWQINQSGKIYDVMNWFA